MHLKKIFVIIILFIRFFQYSYCQNSIVCEYVYYSMPKTPLEFASIQCYNCYNFSIGQFIVGTITDSSGKFSIKKMEEVKYYYIINMVNLYSRKDTLSNDYKFLKKI